MVTRDLLSYEKFCPTALELGGISSLNRKRRMDSLHNAGTAPPHSNLKFLLSELLGYPTPRFGKIIEGFRKLDSPIDTRADVPTEVAARANSPCSSCKTNSLILS